MIEVICFHLRPFEFIIFDFFILSQIKFLYKKSYFHHITAILHLEHQNSKPIPRISTNTFEKQFDMRHKTNFGIMNYFNPLLIKSASGRGSLPRKSIYNFIGSSESPRSSIFFLKANDNS